MIQARNDPSPRQPRPEAIQAQSNPGPERPKPRIVGARNDPRPKRSKPEATQPGIIPARSDPSLGRSELKTLQTRRAPAEEERFWLTARSEPRGPAIEISGYSGPAVTPSAGGASGWRRGASRRRPDRPCPPAPRPVPSLGPHPRAPRPRHLPRVRPLRRRRGGRDRSPVPSELGHQPGRVPRREVPRTQVPRRETARRKEPRRERSRMEARPPTMVRTDVPPREAPRVDRTPAGVNPTPAGMDPMPHGMDPMPHGMNPMPHGMESMPHGMTATPYGTDRPFPGTDRDRGRVSGFQRWASALWRSRSPLRRRPEG